ncbi:hypothetical protein Back2_05530 [Nocardioides baekrokdamisoli]|uniref:DUF559 domain-containing protein n=1 Tax=Nocardioides baekrokdamisoli TaxID=1804624 RepID=A0A3G9ID29_9ACTN|nr:type IV toxin-antitoxin system AbiEi family antitoxin domain-containing protein [Nocardioides baekrokdamisoli]BBH16266.1 hypothetical protein Back2_05530 [Nocardioides baekrokdamisoli]
MDDEGLARLLRWTQEGIVARRQLTSLGATHGDIERMTRRRELTRIHRGVFANHTGPLSWDQRAWAAVLALEPAALCFRSAMPGGPRTGPVHVAVTAQRSTPRYAGVVVHRMADLGHRVNWNGEPPCVWPAHATLDVAARAADEAEAFTAIATAIQTREVWPDSLRQALEGRPRIARRRLLSALIDDVATGQHSVLERGFAALERRHGLPQSQRQVVAVGPDGTIHRDVVYPSQGIVVELDGRAFHSSTQARDHDAARDLKAAADGMVPVRLTYGQVFRDGCRTAANLATLLRRRGWSGVQTRCPNCS